MQAEIEAKFLNIDPAKDRAKLRSLRAKLIHAERLMRRSNFDYPDHRLDNERMAWVRVRDEGDKVTTSYKQYDDNTIDGVKEIDVEINSFESMKAIYEAIGLVQRNYQETKREKWELDGVEIVIDTWPWLPCYVEIEGPDEARVKAVAAKLGFDWSKAEHRTADLIYELYYQVTDKEVNTLSELKFEKNCPWRKK